MKRYRLTASYEKTEIEYDNQDDTLTVIIPMIDKTSQLNYGISKVYNKLIDNGVVPKEEGLDVLCLATLVYLADTRISRNLHSQDSWTREIAIEIPVFEIEKFNQASKYFEKMLNFLTGDKWYIEFSKREAPLIHVQEGSVEQIIVDEVSLFSGGMDSLISTINFLEQNKKVMLISHAGEGFTKNSQTNILNILYEKYPKLKPFYLDLWMVFEKDFIPEGGGENSTRSRSFLFIAFGIFTISGLNNINTLRVPENGLIALNIPLDDLRLGSHSTRTTHPYYLNKWNEVLEILKLDTNVENPYWDKTKGEMADECLNKTFLYEIMGQSASCSSPSKARWKHLPQQHCGYCVPCIIRRAAMTKAFGVDNDNTVYTTKNVSQIIKSHSQGSGVQLRSFQLAIKRIKENPANADLLVYKTGSIPGDLTYVKKLADVYRRGLLEVEDFINKSLKEEE